MSWTVRCNECDDEWTMPVKKQAVLRAERHNEIFTHRSYVEELQ